MSTPEHPAAPRPVLKAMLLCDRAIREQGTNKVTLVGIFDRMAAPVFPLQYVGSLAVYARITDAEGRYQVRIELVRLEDEQTIGRGEAEVEVPSRMGSYEILHHIAVLAFERPGTYEFRIFANGLFVGSAPLYVIKSDEEAGDVER